MKRNRKGLFVFIIVGLIIQANTAWANPLDRIHRTVLQNISIARTEREIFGKVKAQVTPLVPKGPGPAFSRTRETRLFRDFPKPDFEPEAFKADIEKLFGKRVAAKIIKTAKNTTMNIRNAQKGKEFRVFAAEKIKEFVKNGREFVKAAPNREVSAPKLRLSVKKNLFDPNRERFRPRKEFSTGFTGFKR